MTVFVKRMTAPRDANRIEVRVVTTVRGLGWKGETRRMKRNSAKSWRGRPASFCAALVLLTAAAFDPVYAGWEDTPGLETTGVRAATDAGEGTGGPPVRGVFEAIPPKYERRYLRWKSEYLSTEAGREQWARYAHRDDFLLVVTVSPGLGRGARAGDYRWDASGRLVSATIFLGKDIEKGYPTNTNYPVTCALGLGAHQGGVEREVLAAAKLAHEFGHVSDTSTRDASAYASQNRLILEYGEMFKANGFDAKDERLIDIERRLGGTPAQIIQRREFVAETYVAAYLQEKFSRGGDVNSMPSPIREAIESFYQLQLR